MQDKGLIRGGVYVMLDCDGVTHGVGRPTFDADALAAIEAAITPYRAQIVITSSWRETYPLERLRLRLGPLSERVVDVTPVLQPMTHARYHEVLTWLRQNAPGAPWVALEDDPDCYPASAPVYLTDTRQGFVRADIDPLQAMIRELLT